MAGVRVKKKPEERKAQILEAAFKCFMRKGYHRTTMDDIARTARLSKGAVYWYFKDKHDVFIAFTYHQFQDQQDKVSELTSGTASLEKKIKEFGHFLLDQAEKSPERHRALHEVQIQALDNPRVWKAFKQIYNNFIDVAGKMAGESIRKGELATGSNPSWVALLLVSAMDNLDHMQMFGPDSIDPHAYWEWAVSVLFTGLNQTGKVARGKASAAARKGDGA